MDTLFRYAVGAFGIHYGYYGLFPLYVETKYLILSKFFQKPSLKEKTFVL